MGKVVGAVAMSLAVASTGQGWAQPVPPPVMGEASATVSQKVETKTTHEVGAPEPAAVAVSVPAAVSQTTVERSTTVQLEKGAPVAPAPVVGAIAQPTPRGMGVPLFPAPAVTAQAGISAPYGQGLAAAAPVGTPYLRSPAFAGPPIIYMPQTVTRVLLPGATPYPSNIMSPPASYVYASAPFTRTDIYTSLPYGTFYWPQGYAGTVPVEPQVPAYVTAPASAIMSTEADYTAARYEPGVASAETLNPITSGINSNLVATTGLSTQNENASAASVAATGPGTPTDLTIVPETSVKVESLGPEAAPSMEAPAAVVPAPAAVEPFPVLTEGTAVVPAPAAPVVPAPTPAPNEVPGLPSLPATTPAAVEVPALPVLPAATPAPAAPGLPTLPAATPADTSALPALPSANTEVALALPSLPAATAAVPAAPANLVPSLPTPAVPAGPATEIIVDDKTPGALTLTPADAWTPSASTADSHDGSSLMATVAAGQPKTATFNATIPADGQYQVSLWWVGGAPEFRSNSVPVTVNTATGPQAATIDQTKSGQWNVLGTYSLKAGQNVPVVTVSTDGIAPQGSTVSVSVDALRLTPQ